MMGPIQSGATKMLKKWKNIKNDSEVYFCSIPHGVSEIFANNRVNASVHVVYSSLLKRVNKTKGYCWPSISNLVEETKLSHVTLTKAFKTLKELNCIDFQRRFGYNQIYLVRTVWNYNDPIWGNDSKETDEVKEFVAEEVSGEQHSEDKVQPQTAIETELSERKEVVETSNIVTQNPEPVNQKSKETEKTLETEEEQKASEYFEEEEKTTPVVQTDRTNIVEILNTINNISKKSKYFLAEEPITDETEEEKSLQEEDSDFDLMDWDQEAIKIGIK